MGFALKHGSGKRTTFSQAQKDILIEFHERQAINRICAEPKDVMKVMEDDILCGQKLWASVPYQAEHHMATR